MLIIEEKNFTVIASALLEDRTNVSGLGARIDFLIRKVLVPSEETQKRIGFLSRSRSRSIIENNNIIIDVSQH